MSEPDQPFRPSDVYNDEGYYAVIPEWVLDADVSAQAIRLYAVLRRYADQRTREAHPSRKTLAGRIKVNDVKVVDRALTDLQRIGAVEVFGRWTNETGEIVYQPDDDHRERSSNGYRLRRAPAVSGGRGGGPEGTRGGGPEGAGVGVEKGEKPQPPNHSQGNHKGTTAEGITHVSRGEDQQPPRGVPAQPPPAPTPEDPEPPATCGRLHPPGQPCQPCGDARRGHAEWTARQLARRRQADAAERERQREAARLRDREGDDCRLCDESGTAWVGEESVACLHLSEADNRARLQKRLDLREALRRRSAS